MAARWALRAWALVAACGAVAWAGEQGHLGGSRPDPGVVLARPEPGLALAVGLGVAAIPADVTPRSWRFGLRRLVVAAGAVLLAATVPTGRGAGRPLGHAPPTSYASVVRFVDRDPAGGMPWVLWVGDPRWSRAGRGWALRGGLTFATSIRSLPWSRTCGPPPARPATPVRGALNAAVDGQTTRLGEALASSGVAYLAVPLTLAPGDDTPAAPATRELTGALAEQLDLKQVHVDRDLVLYRNAAFDPEAAARAAPPAPPARGLRRPPSWRCGWWCWSSSCACGSPCLRPPPATPLPALPARTGPGPSLGRMPRPKPTAEVGV